MKVILTILGFIFLGLGAIGIFLPLLSTTPFVLVAALCFSSGNKKAFDLLKQNRFFAVALQYTFY